MFSSKLYPILKNDRNSSKVAWRYLYSNLNVPNKQIRCDKLLNRRMQSDRLWNKVFHQNLIFNAKFSTSGVFSCNAAESYKPEESVESLKSSVEETYVARDVFGYLGKNVIRVDDESEYIETSARPSVPRKLKPSAKGYVDMIKNYLQKGDLISAYNTLALIKKNGDKPNEYHFALLINAHAHQGNIVLCMDMFRQMRRYKMKIKPNIITSLINACSNCAQTKKAEKYLAQVVEYVEKTNYPIHHVHYNVLIKAYGRHNKVEEAYKLADYMIEQRMKVGVSTLNSLMSAAISEESGGLKNVIRTWQLMQIIKIPPDIFTFNLLLKAIRDTKFGDGCKPQDLLWNSKEILSIEIKTDSNRPNLLENPPVIANISLPVRKEPLLLTGGRREIRRKLMKQKKMEAKKKESKDIALQSPQEINLDEILKENKLILFGGCTNFLERMEKNKIKPDVKTLTFLMELVPGSVTAENMIIQYASYKGIVLDIDFYNILMKKRCARKCFDDAKAVFEEINIKGFKPNIMTYGILAMACTNKYEARELIHTMQKIGLSLNKYIVGALLTNAFKQLNFKLIHEIMEKVIKERIRVDEELLDMFDKFQKYLAKLIKEKHRFSETEAFKERFRIFKMRYPKWMEALKKNNDLGSKVERHNLKVKEQ